MQEVRETVRNEHNVKTVVVTIFFHDEVIILSDAGKFMDVYLASLIDAARGQAQAAGTLAPAKPGRVKVPLE